jgi:Tol biopolymer transport system component
MGRRNAASARWKTGPTARRSRAALSLFLALATGGICVIVPARVAAAEPNRTKCLSVASPASNVESAASAGAVTTDGVSVTASGRAGDAASADPAISEDGRFVAFQSFASDLVEHDTNKAADVFLRDTVAGTTVQVSVSTANAGGNAASTQAAISGNGRFVAFQSRASNLVDGDTNGLEDVFVWDRRTGDTSRVTDSVTGHQANGRSADAAISWNGRYAAFVSEASNLVRGDRNGKRDVFVRDRWTGVTMRVSQPLWSEGSGDSGDPGISDDGGVVVFHSLASNLVAGDTNRARDIFAWERAGRIVKRVNVSSTGTEANQPSTDPFVSANGRFVIFGSLATTVVRGDTNDAIDQFLHDRRTGTTIRVSLSWRGRQANAASCDATISRDGRYVAFASIATNLVPNDTNGWRDVFVRDRQTGATVRVSVSTAEQPGDRSSADARISADGEVIAFRSAATNLMAADMNQSTDIFVRGPLH